MSPDTLRYCLFVDETGYFTGVHPDSEIMKEIEESIRKNIAAKKRSAGKGDYPSQIVGFWVDKGHCLTEERARMILSQAWEEAGLDKPKEYHLTKVTGHEARMKIGRHVWSEARNLHLQPIRITGRTHDTSKGPVSYGDHRGTYVRFFAELIFRFFKKIQENKGNDSLIALEITGASVKCSDSGETIKPDDYCRAIDEQFSFYAVRSGVSDLLDEKWKYSLNSRPANQSYRLQLCDILSNTSFWAGRSPDFDPTLTQMIEETLGGWDLKSLYVPESEEKLEEMIERGEVATALLRLCFCQEEWKSRLPLKTSYFNIMDKALLALVAMDDESCSQQLRILTDWIHRLGSIRRQLGKTKETIGWMEKEVAVALERKGKPIHFRDFNWYLDILLLETLNHMGNLRAAREVAQKLEEKTPVFSTRLDYFPTLAKAFNLQAVHLTDCLDYDGVRTKMQPLAEALKSLGESLSKCLAPTPIAGRTANFMSSDLGKAVGSWLQAEAAAGLADPARLEFARKLSDEALKHFEKTNDRQRQLQYRSIIETYCGDFKKAMECLEESLPYITQTALPSTHFRLAEEISEIPVEKLNFPLLHWTRIGVEAVRQGDEAEARSFFAAFRSSPLPERLLKSSVETGAAETPQEYPMHGILRNLAVIHASLEETSRWSKYLQLLKEIAPEAGNGFNILSLYPVFSIAECLAMRVKGGFNDFDREDELRNLFESLEELKKEARSFPHVLNRIEALSEAITATGGSPRSGHQPLTRPDKIIIAARRLPS